MGSFLSKTDDTSSSIKELKERLANIEKLDRNADGVVSKEELDLWMNEQKKDIEKFKQKIEESTEAKYQHMILENERELNDAKQELKDLKKQVKTLKNINNNLEEKLQKECDDTIINTNVDITQHKKYLTELSKKRINKVVEKILEDENINIKYLPDFVEKQIYKNVFNIFINLLDNLFDMTTVKFMGHKLTFDLQPLLDEDLDKSENDMSNKKSKSNKN